MAYDKQKLDAYIQENRSRFLQEFAELIAIPSVAADGRDTQEAADWITERLKKVGASVQQYPLHNSKSPVVVAEIGTGQRSLMVYNHYDVQPEMPVADWDSPPFTLTERDGLLFGRGVADDKGELLSRIQVLEAWHATQGELPLHIKFVIEGEEEIGSVNLEHWADQHRDILQADGCLWEGGGRDEKDRITMAEGCKGIAYFELHCEHAAYDLHSSLAPIITNPAWRLVWALASIKDANDRITIDGYWEHVRGFSDNVLAVIDGLPFEADEMKAIYGVDQWINGMSDHEAMRRYSVEPTLTICGFNSGHIAGGTKTIVPAKGVVKLDFRLVPDLTPDLVENLLRQHLDKRGFTDIKTVRLAGEYPAMKPVDSAVRRAAIEASKVALGQEPIIYPWFAGSGPMYPLSVMLDIPAISGGATWHPKARVHAPNENIYTEDYFKAMHFMAALMDAFA